jgi:hypothetical protein
MHVALLSTLSSISRAATGQGGGLHTADGAFWASYCSSEHAPNRLLTAVTSWGLWDKKKDAPRIMLVYLYNAASILVLRTLYCKQRLEEPRDGDTDCLLQCIAFESGQRAAMSNSSQQPHQKLMKLTISLFASRCVR